MHTLAGLLDSLDPHQGVVEFWVDGLQVLYGWLLSQHLLVERHAEAVVYELAMVKGLQHTYTHI